MIARRHYVGAGIEQLDENLLGDAEAAGGVLAVHHDEVEAIAFAQQRQSLDDRVAARASDHISEKQNPH